MDYLGDTLEKIAVEKAGIIKPGIPVVFNVDDEKAAAEIRRIAGEKGSRVYEVGGSGFNIKEKTVDCYTFDAEILGTGYSDLSITMIGAHQISNAVCALTVLELLRRENVVRLDMGKLYSGFRKAKQTGRFEILSKEPYVIIDGAHNEAGAESLWAVMAEHFPDRRILMVTGMLADKKIDKLLDKFELIADDFIATEPDNPRKLSAFDLCSQIQKRGKSCAAIEDPERAYRYAGKLSSSYDVTVYAGSLYLIGKIRGLLIHEEK
jgi:dihydrofolate synthase/folylpolyglutamate synthase